MVPTIRVHRGLALQVVQLSTILTRHRLRATRHAWRTLKKAMVFLPMAFRIIYDLFLPKNDGCLDLARQKKSEDTQTLVTKSENLSSSESAVHLLELFPLSNI